jgi:hypothetical protein
MERKKCILCNSSDLSVVLNKDINVFESLCVISGIENKKSVKFNIYKCNCCFCYQNKYLIDPNILYASSHIFPIGSIRSSMDIKFSSMISKNKNITQIIEIGGGNGVLSDILTKVLKTTYYIIDPSYIGNTENRLVISQFIENIDMNKYEGANTIIMSHLFEHLYSPFETLKKIMTSNIQYLYICHPDFDAYITQTPINLCVLNIEHTFVVDNETIVKFLANMGYIKTNEIFHENYCVMWEFTKTDESFNLQTINTVCQKYIPLYLENIQSRVFYINRILKSEEYKDFKKYIWPCSCHSILLLNYGIEHVFLDGVLDNSINKIGKYIYGYNIQCLSFEEIKNSQQNTIIFLNGGCYNKELHNLNKKNIIFITI